MAKDLKEIATPLQIAYDLADVGIKIIAVHGIRNGICTCAKGKECKSSGKHPIETKWIDSATADPTIIAKVIIGARNVGVPMGSINGIFAVDFDGPEGMETYREWFDIGLPATWEIETGSGGRQLWFKIPDGIIIPNSVKKIGKNVDLRGEGGQSVAPGSLHISGKRYRWLRGPQDTEIAYPPTWLLEKISKISSEQTKMETVEIKEISCTDELRQKLGRVLLKNITLRDIFEEKLVYPSASERDQSIANLLFVNDFTPEEIACLLKEIRASNKDNLKEDNPRYYELTIAKAIEWAKDQNNEVIETVIEETDEVIEELIIPPPPPLVIDEFPVTVFPTPIREYIKSVSKSIGSPADFVGNPLLAICGAAIGKKFVVELVDGYRKFPNLYCAVVGKPGTAKTPNQKAAFKPVEEVQKHHKAEYDKKKEQYLDDLGEYKAKLAKWKQDKTAYNGAPKEPPKEMMKEVYSTHATTESIAKILSNNPEGMVLKLDELSGLVNGLNQYKGGKGDDLEFYLSMWGNVTYKSNRAKDDEPLILPDPFLSIIGNIPPDLLPKLKSNGVEDGFVDRFLISYPDDHKKKYFSSTGIPPKIYAGYAKAVKALYKLHAEKPLTGIEPNVMRFDQDAYQLFLEWDKEHTDQINSETLDKTLIGPFNKMSDQILSISVIMHLLRCVCETKLDLLTIDYTSFMCAWELINYFKTHLKKVYVKIETTIDEDRAIKAITRIKDLGGEVSMREAIQMKLVGCKKKSEVKELFETLADFGYGTVITIKPKRGPTAMKFSIKL
jgi:hypothetical protein